jgi:hypothetical protein
MGWCGLVGVERRPMASSIFVEEDLGDVAYRSLLDQFG